MNPFLARAVRVQTSALEARLGAELGRLVNVSATGALVRTHTPVVAGRQSPLVLNLADGSPTTLLVQVVRTDAAPLAAPGAEIIRMRQYHTGVTFLELSGPAKHAVATLCGAALTQRE